MGKMLLAQFGEIHPSILEEMNVKTALVGFEVFFDVEAVLNNSKWLNFLIDSGGVVQKEGTYFHKLYPIWVQK